MQCCQLYKGNYFEPPVPSVRYTSPLKMLGLLVCFLFSIRQRWKKSNKYNGRENPEIASSRYWARSFILSWKWASLSSSFTLFFLMLIYLDILAFILLKNTCICNAQNFPYKLKHTHAFPPLFFLPIMWITKSSWAKTNLLPNQKHMASGILSLSGFIGSNHL